LDVLEFSEPQPRFGHDENVPALSVFVNQNGPVVRLFRLYLFEDAFPLEHDGENVTGVGVRRIVLGEETAQKFLGAFLGKRFWRRGRGRFVARFPKGKWPDIFVALGPCLFAQIFAAKTVAFAKEQRVELLARLEQPPGSRAGVRAMFDRPFVCQARVHRAITGRARRKPRCGGSRFVAR